MFDALPNLHAAVLHGPIVLLPLAVVVQVVSMIRRENRTLAVVSVSAWVLATSATALTFVAGRWAADGLVDVPPEAMLRIGEHADWAWWVLVGAIAALVVRLGAAVAGKHVAAHVFSGLTLVVGLALMPVIALTGDAGGTLVFDYGLAVRVPEVVCPQPETCPDAEPTAPLTTVGNTVAFAPSDPAKPFTSFQDMDTGGLVQVQDGEKTVLLDGTWSDVQLNAWLDLSEFDGVARLLHHVGSTSGAFTIGPDGTALVGIDGAVLDRSDEPAPDSGAFAINVAGSHLKGIVDGRSVTHGHANSGSAGAVGLQFSGTGQVTIRRLEAIRLSAE